MSLISVITTTAQSVLAGGSIPLNTIARRKGCAIQYNQNGLTLNKVGYYKVSGTITFTAGSAGNVTIDLAKNGESIQGITSTASVTTASTEINTLYIDGIVRVFCCEANPTLTLNNDGIAINTSNVCLNVEYLG